MALLNKSKRNRENFLKIIRRHGNLPMLITIFKMHLAVILAVICRMIICFTIE